MTEAFLHKIDSLLDDPDVAGLRFVTRYDSALGPTVTPPAGTLDPTSVHDHGLFQLPDQRTAVTLDSWGSQASRMEYAAETVSEHTNFPLIRMLDEDGGLLTTNVRLSHRQADATWRLAQDELKAAGIPYDEIKVATTSHPDPLLRWFPTSVLMGWWHSHTDKEDKNKEVAKEHGQDVADALKGYSKVHSSARSARLVTAEIIAAGVARRIRRAARQDTLFGPRAARTKNAPKPSAMGLGSLPPVEAHKAPVDVTFDDITGYWFFSFTGLHQFTWKETPPKTANRLLIALGILLREEALRDSRLRAGTELIAQGSERHCEVLRHGREPDNIEVPGLQELRDLVTKLGEECGWTGPHDVRIPHDSPLEKMLTGTHKDSEGEQ